MKTNNGNNGEDTLQNNEAHSHPFAGVDFHPPKPDVQAREQQRDGDGVGQVPHRRLQGWRRPRQVSLGDDARAVEYILLTRVLLQVNALRAVPAFALFATSSSPLFRLDHPFPHVTPLDSFTRRSRRRYCTYTRNAFSSFSPLSPNPRCTSSPLAIYLSFCAVANCRLC
jgi:hypothetical protein